jgi:hypothetical protein
MNRLLSWIVLAVVVVYVAAAAARLPGPVHGMDVAAFGRLPVAVSGGIHPVDTVARLSLKRIRGTDTVPIESYSLRRFWHLPRALGPTEWLLEVMTMPEADTRPVFPVSPALAQRLAVGSWRYHSFNELQPKINALTAERLTASPLQKPAAREPWEADLAVLRSSLTIYARLRTMMLPGAFTAYANGGHYDFMPYLVKYQKDLNAVLETKQAHGPGAEKPVDPAIATSIRVFAAPFTAVAREGFVGWIPPAQASRAGDDWQTVGTAVVESTREGRLRPAVVYLARICTAFAKGDATGFNVEAARYRQWLRARGFSGDVTRAGYEYYYQRVDPLARATALYVGALMLFAVAAWRGSPARRVPVSVMLSGLALHGVGVIWLALLSGGLPPFNLYTGAVVGGLMGALLVTGIALVGRRPLALAPLAGLMALLVAQASIAAALRFTGQALEWRFALAFVLVAAVMYAAGTMPVAQRLTVRSAARM